MARSRVYRHDVRCPDCGSNWMRKESGRAQAYRYGAYRLQAVKERAIAMYTASFS